jgi:hypothetical protein
MENDKRPPVNYSRRKRFKKYDTIEPLPVADDKSQIDDFDFNRYPNFLPDRASFNHDRLYRAGFTYSERNYQTYAKYLSEADQQTYKDAMLSGVDIFRRSASFTSIWLSKPEVAEEYQKRRLQIRHLSNKNEYLRPQHLEDPQANLFFTPRNPVNVLFGYLREAYHYITRGELHRSYATYYFYYYYFFFTEYTLENVYLYFPLLRILFETRAFSTFEPVYFGFFEITAGCYIPVLALFFFSQYSIIRQYFTHKIYFFLGSLSFLYLLTLPVIYYFVGYSTLFIFLSFYIFVVVFSAFYIFELRPFFYPEKYQFRAYSSYFLPIYFKPQPNFLPLYYFYYRNWIASNKPPQGRRQNFTRYPFVQNVKTIVAFKRRKAAFIINQLSISKKVTFYPAPTISMTGPVFPKARNIFGYSYPNHKYHLSTYPGGNFSPYTETDDGDFYSQEEKDFEVLYVRDYLNHPDGSSYTSFLEFVSKNKAAYSFDSQFQYMYEEEKDFYTSVPSQSFVNYLYPYIYLRQWLNSLDPENASDSDFTLLDIPFSTKKLNVQNDLPSTLFIPSFLVYLIDLFFFYLTRSLDKITFYNFKKFPSPSGTADFSNSLREANKILIDSKHLSPRFYKNLFILVYRGYSRLNIEFSKNTINFHRTFTYMLILRQLEEIYFNVNHRNAYLDKATSTYKVASFFMQALARKVPSFSSLNIKKK